MPTALHRRSSADIDLTLRVLRGTWRWQPPHEPPVSAATLATMLTELAVGLRGESGETDLTRRLLAMSGWLNSPLECPWVLQPPARARVRRRWSLRRKDLPR
ncbi:MAG TPA: hypothetical protein VEO01_40610 [Pseudonocardiaceae bacterium]|nr:hypothetical protein [Pseudonocardiaceae bacterium]